MATAKKMPAEVLMQELDPGENLLWAGQSRKSIILKGLDYIGVPYLMVFGFGLAFGGGAVAVAAFTTRTPWGSDLAALLSIAAGICIAFGPLVSEAKSRASTYYGVTSERVLILTLWPRWKATSHILRLLSEISLDSRRDGNGTLVFGPNTGYITGGSGPAGHRSPMTFAFERIDDVNGVHDIIHSVHESDSASKVGGS